VSFKSLATLLKDNSFRCLSLIIPFRPTNLDRFIKTASEFLLKAAKSLKWKSFNKSLVGMRPSMINLNIWYSSILKISIWPTNEFSQDPSMISRQNYLNKLSTFLCNSKFVIIRNLNNKIPQEIKPSIDLLSLKS
jgi:hypothetical protein